MNTLKNHFPDTETAKISARQTPPTKAIFLRVLVRRADSTKYTTVSISAEYLAKALPLAYGVPSGVTSALRRAAHFVKEKRRGHFSEVVRARALASLRGGYQPARAAALIAASDAEHVLQEENNAAWKAAG